MEATCSLLRRSVSCFYLRANEVPNTNPKEDISMVVPWAPDTGGGGNRVVNLQHATKGLSLNACTLKMKAVRGKVGMGRGRCRLEIQEPPLMEPSEINFPLVDRKRMIHKKSFWKAEVIGGKTLKTRKKMSETQYSDLELRRQNYTELVFVLTVKIHTEGFLYA